MNKKLPMPPRRDHHGQPMPALFDTKPFHVSGLTKAGKPFEPKEGVIGSEITFHASDGSHITAQVWSRTDEPKEVWAVADQVAYRVRHAAAYWYETNRMWRYPRT